MKQSIRENLNAQIAVRLSLDQAQEVMPLQNLMQKIPVEKSAEGKARNAGCETMHPAIRPLGTLVIVI